MNNRTYSLSQAFNTLILSSLLVSTGAFAQGNASSTVARLSLSQAASQSTSNDDCYRGGRSGRLLLKVTDLASLWHYATRILLPTAAVSAAPIRNSDARRNDKGLVWRVGTQNGGVLVSAKLDW